MSNKSEKPVSKYASIVLLSVGTVLVVVAAVVAFNSFYGFVLPEVKGSTIEEAVISLVRNLVELASKLGFLGVVVWAGSVLLKYGVQLLKS